MTLVAMIRRRANRLARKKLFEAEVTFATMGACPEPTTTAPTAS
jgi:hypothetical protein